MAETKINFIKGRPENVNNGQERNQHKEERVRQKQEKNSLEKTVSRIMEKEGIGLEEALKIANEKTNKPRFPRVEGSQKFGNRPQRPRFEKKEGAWENRPRNSSFEKKDGAQEDRQRPRFEKKEGAWENRPRRQEGSKFQSEKPVSERYKGSKPRKSSVPFGERRNVSRDNALISDFQRKLEILKNANKLDD